MAIDLIAEISWNHLGDLNLLQKMIRAAGENGATHAKLQVWREKHLKTGPWDYDGRREMYKKAELTEPQLEEAKRFCDEAQISFIVSIFDSRDIDAVAKLSNKHIKIPSPEIANLELIRNVAGIFEHVYLSTGASTEAEIDNALDLLSSGGAEIVLMHCVSIYPCPDDCVNLPRVNHLKNKHSSVGISDHTPDTLSCLFSLGMGIVAIEKHFTVDRDLPGKDNAYAILPSQLAELAEAIRRYEQMDRDKGLKFLPEEQEVREIYRGRWCA